MSDTEKDWPNWVRNHTHGRIVHHHEGGECVIETLELTRQLRTQPSRWAHASTCAKYEWDVWFCDKQTREPGCWRADRDPVWIDGIRVEIRWRATQCTGHRLRTHHPDRPCSCDATPAAPTCTPERVYGSRWAYWSNDTPPREFRRDTWFGPERARERDQLRGAAREYNAHGEVDDFDFDNPQARHRASWWWSW